MTEALREDAEALLLWINAHSVSIADGIPITLLQQKWQQGGRTLAQLKDVLEILFGQTLLAVTPGVSPPHVRLSGRGFQHLLDEVDRTRTPPPEATHAVAVAGGAPQPPAAPIRFLEPGRPPTEIALRNQVLHIFRDLKLQSGQLLIAITLTRYWQEMGLRSGDLRLAIDVLLRDRYVKPATKRYESHWQLTDVGHAFLHGPITPPALLALAKPVSRVTDSYSDADLTRQAWQLFRSGQPRRFSELQAEWQYGLESLLHALDLLYKAKGLDIGSDDAVTCTPNMHVRPRH